MGLRLWISLSYLILYGTLVDYILPRPPKERERLRYRAGPRTFREGPRFTGGPARLTRPRASGASDGEDDTPIHLWRAPFLYRGRTPLLVIRWSICYRPSADSSAFSLYIQKPANLLMIRWSIYIGEVGLYSYLHLFIYLYRRNRNEKECCIWY
jgi:hypothetical protein